MVGGNLVAIVIVLFFVFLTMGAIVSVVQELTAQLIRARSRSLRKTVLRMLEDEYRDQGGRKYLYSLFPRGPITQGCRLAGLPTPAGNTDPSFGIVH